MSGGGLFSAAAFSHVDPLRHLRHVDRRTSRLPKLTAHAWSSGTSVGFRAVRLGTEMSRFGRNASVAIGPHHGRSITTRTVSAARPLFRCCPQPVFKLRVRSYEHGLVKTAISSRSRPAFSLPSATLLKQRRKRTRVRRPNLGIISPVVGLT